MGGEPYSILSAHAIRSAPYIHSLLQEPLRLALRRSRWRGIAGLARCARTLIGIAGDRLLDVGETPLELADPLANGGADLRQSLGAEEEQDDQTSLNERAFRALGEVYTWRSVKVACGDLGIS
jgi:hypothetical protein